MPKQLIDGMLDLEPIAEVEVSSMITSFKFVPEGKSKPIFTYYEGGGGVDGYSMACDGTRLGNAIYDADPGVLVLPDGTTEP